MADILKTPEDGISDKTELLLEYKEEIKQD